MHRHKSDASLRGSALSSAANPHQRPLKKNQKNRFPPVHEAQLSSVKRIEARQEGGFRRAKGLAN